MLELIASSKEHVLKRSVTKHYAAFVSNKWKVSRNYHRCG